MIAIIDYQMGNVQSVLNAVEHVGARAAIVRSPQGLEAADKVILPGVGAFAAGMENLRKLGFVEALEKSVLKEKTPFLGICLGMQLLCRESSEFGLHPGLGWIDAAVRPFDKDLGLRIPHMGWNSLRVERENRLIRAEKPGADLDVYFVHSFFVDAPGAEFVSATCEYGARFAAAIEKGNIFATQFHLEKSQKTGLDILRRFCEPC